MTKLLSIAIVLLVVFVGYRIWVYWDQQQYLEAEKAKAAAAAVIRTDTQLGGMSYELEEPLRLAREHGAASLKAWLQANGSRVSDPRLAWIQLDLAVLLSRSSPKEAKDLYALVRQRTPTNSPVYPRIKELERGFE